MAFASIHIPDFLVQAVVRAEPALRGAAIALVDGTPPLWNVVAANEAASRAGISWAWRARWPSNSTPSKFVLVPARRRKPPTPLCSIWDGRFRRAWKTPRRTRSSLISPAFLLLFGSDENIADQLAQRASAFGLTAHVAVASNLEAAIHAARGFPGITLIAPGEESQRLGCLPVGVLGRFRGNSRNAGALGRAHLRGLAALPVLHLSERLGQEGVRLHDGRVAPACVRWCWPNPASVSKRKWSSKIPSKSSSLWHFCWAACSISSARDCKARSLAASAIHVRFELDPSGKKDLQIRNDRFSPEKANRTSTKKL